MPATYAIPAVHPFPHKLLVPSMVEIFFAVILMAAFARPGGWQALLADGDTGWHVRTGQMILASGRVPVADDFSFTRPGQKWFAWEWLSDVVFAAAFNRGGLAAVAVLAALILCLSAALVLQWLLDAGAGLWIGLGVTLAAASASSIHYLARPHVFSILLYTVTLRVLDRDSRRRGAAVWLLVPLAALWANLHGGFVLLPATLAFRGATYACARDFEGARRDALLAFSCLAATVLNPYGCRLHAHILEYLGSSWILENVQEFQSPSIRSEGMVVFAMLLLTGTALVSRAFTRKQWFEGGLVLAWGFASLRSARHIPFYAIAAAPLVAAECARAWQRRAAAAPDSVWGVLCGVGQDLGRWRHAGTWLVAVAAAALAVPPYGSAVDFPASRFPERALARNAALLTPAGSTPRVLTSDQWGDYIIFRLYPRQRVFFDGRSDFYGPVLGSDYRTLLTARGNWRELLDRYGFELALLPHDWPLSTMLDREPGWRKEYQDGVAVLYARSLPRRAG